METTLNSNQRCLKILDTFRLTNLDHPLRVDLVLDSTNSSHVSLDTVAEFEGAIREDTSCSVRTVKSNRLLTAGAYRAWRSCKRYRDARIVATFGNLLPGLGHRTERLTICVLMGTDWTKCFPYFALPGSKAIYLFDAWPQSHQSICEFVERCHIDKVFLSSSTATSMLQSKSGTNKYVWIPEGVDTHQYRHQPFEQRDIDILALGRRYDACHEKILDDHQLSGFTYLYEKEKGNIIFPSRESFIEGLSRTKISLCFPSSMTHPARSGDIETMTTRYLQSMSSKCLVVGHAPAEMIALFGYNPVVEMDMSRPTGQIAAILHDYESYVPLIQRNFDVVSNGHTWSHRWKLMLNLMENDVAVKTQGSI